MLRKISISRLFWFEHEKKHITLFSRGTLAPWCQAQSESYKQQWQKAATKDKKFAKKIMPWAEKKSEQLVFISEKSINIDHIDALLIFNENQEHSKEIFDIKIAFDNKQKSTLKLDINGIEPYYMNQRKNLKKI